MDKELSQIELSEIKTQIPNILMNKLNMLGLRNIQDIKAFSIEDFSKVKSIGAKTIELYRNLKFMIDNEPEKLLYNNNHVHEEYSAIPHEIRSIEIKYLTSLIPSRLFKKLNLAECRTVDDVLRIKVSDFKKIESVGQASEEDLLQFRKQIVSTPQNVKEAYLKECEPILPITKHDLLINDFNQFVTDYFLLLNDRKAKDIIEKRFSLNGNKRYTFEDIGLFYDISRQRVQQIETKHLQKLSSLLEGSVIKNPYCRLDKKLIDTFTEIRANIQNQKIITSDYISSVFTANGMPNVDTQNGIILLLLAVGNVSDYDFNGTQVFIVNNSYTYQDFVLTCNTLITYLQDMVIPVPFIEIVIALRKKKKITKELIEIVIGILPYVEQIENAEKVFFQISFHKLRSLKDCAYRVLYEKNEVMHATDIWREIRHRLTKSDMDSQATCTSMKNQLVSSPLFSSIGKTGKWGLTVWNNDSSSIVELIEKAFYHYNHECTVRDLFSYISGFRHDVKESSISSIINQHRDKFINVDRGVFALKEWNRHYTIPVEHTRECVSREKLEDILLHIAEKNPNKQYTSKELQQELITSGINWKEGNCYNRFTSITMLVKKKENNRVYYLIDPEKKLPSNSGQSKQVKTVNRIIEMLSNQDTRILKLSDIVNQLASEGEVKASVYSIISDRSTLFKKIEKNKIVYLQLLEKDTNTSSKEDKIDHGQIIQDGESGKTEFKSSLRYDYKTKQLNKELEFMVIKSIAGFLNTDGGILYIGVDDDSGLLGLSNDYQTLSKKNKDGFILYLNSLLIKYFQKFGFSYIKSSVEKISDIEICIVSVERAKKPIFVSKDNEKLFFIRAAASIQSLDPEETVSYIQAHWKS